MSTKSFGHGVWLLALILASASCMKEKNEITKAVELPFRQNASAKVIWPSAKVTAGLTVGIDSEFFVDAVDATEAQSWANFMEQMFSVWNLAHTAYDFYRLPNPSVTNPNYGDLSDYYDSELGVYKSYHWFPDVSSHALAITQYFGNRRQSGTPNEYIELVHADVIVNYRDFRFEFQAGPHYDLPSVLLHELGHFLGLPHQNNFSIASVMQPYIAHTDVKRSLFAYDQQQIQSNYPNSYLMPSGLSAASKGAFSEDESFDEDEEPNVRGIIELRDDGSCQHFENQRLIYRHRWK